MNEALVKDILDKLKNGELHEYRVQKEDFMAFREILVAREDFKHFRGIAKHKGEVIYQYLQEARS
ncbi:hypothetical protein [Sutcliffiella rhizosphaerae]|uniref:Abortive phage infection protein n=1 Tax=Sutcliffiella rhizosphaerae TaxID=2880967 RepID=A0ABN8A655_9BACI|nr:hypothetical protein [Sutcliffiella rhizosphaerae]CAG9620585.1 hypothetical protein BACCIP111883_01354 [Sutcliffiella rhizosphaerae]